MRKIMVSIILSILFSIFLYCGMEYDGILVKIYGISFAVVSSGSMEPELTIGDIIVMKTRDNYEVNDVITYHIDNEYLVTHRIVERNENSFVTKGDSNNTKDAEHILKENIEGKVVFSSKLLGLLYENWLIVIVIILLILIFL